MSGAPPEYGTTATDCFSQLAPPGHQLLEPHDHHVVTTVSSQISLSVLWIPFGVFFWFFAGIGTSGKLILTRVVGGLAYVAKVVHLPSLPEIPFQSSVTRLVFVFIYTLGG